MTLFKIITGLATVFFGFKTISHFSQQRKMQSDFERIFPPMKKVLAKPIEEQAKHADGVTASNANNLDFLREQVAGLENEPIPINVLNGTSIGNIAYVALYSPSPYKEMALKELNRIKSLV